MAALDFLYGLATGIALACMVAFGVLMQPLIASWLKRRIPRTEAGDPDVTALSIGIIPVATIAMLAWVARL